MTNKYSIKDCSLIDLKKIEDPRGDINVIETGINCPFSINRIYYIYNVPHDIERGGHAHYKLEQLLIPISGSFNIGLFDGDKSITYSLNNPNVGLYICPGMWRTLDTFSSSAVALVLASQHYDETDYMRDYNEYRSYRKENC